MTLQIIDKLRIISDLCLIRNNSIKRIDTVEKIIHELQKQLNIPENYEVAVAILSVLFCQYTLCQKVSFSLFKLKMELLEITNVQEDFIYLLNNKYIELGKSANNIEWIQIKSKLYLQLHNDMTKQNHNLFLLIAGKQLNVPQLNFFKSKLLNEGLDISELFRTAVVCRQFEAAKAIISFGYNMNKETEQMGYELFICANYDSKFCIDFYIQQGLKITDALIKEIMKNAQENSDDFEVDKTIALIEELKQNMVN